MNDGVLMQPAAWGQVRLREPAGERILGETLTSGGARRGVTGRCRQRRPGPRDRGAGEARGGGPRDARARLARGREARRVGAGRRGRAGRRGALDRAARLGRGGGASGGCAPAHAGRPVMASRPATVGFAGAASGARPAPVSVLAPSGVRRIRIAANGWRTWESSVVLRGGETLAVGPVTLGQPDAHLTVRSVPEGAD